MLPVAKWSLNLETPKEAGKAMSKPHILWFEDIGIADVPAVGGKNASLGEMTAALSQKGVKVPSGFATTADAYWPSISMLSIPAKRRSRRPAPPSAPSSSRAAFRRGSRTRLSRLTRN